MRSVLQDWVMELGLREQGTLLTGIRGCDLAPKDPLTCNGCSTGEATPERRLVAYLRYLVLVPFDHREIDVPGGWFRSAPGEFHPSQFGHYPLHWIMHIVHCFEVVGYRHPDPTLRERALSIYLRFVRSFHLNQESLLEMESRLSEDRIASGEVVS